MVERKMTLLRRLRESIEWWCDTGKPPVKGATVADKDTLIALYNDLAVYNQAATFNERAVKVLEKLGFRTENTEVGWKIFID